MEQQSTFYQSVQEQSLKKKDNAKEAKAKAKAKAKGRANANEEQEEHGLTVKRTDLHAYKLVIDQTPVFITDICPLVENISLVRSIMEGAAKQARLKEMCNSSEDECIVAVGKETRVHATKKFGIGKFSLYPVSPMIAVSEKVMGWTKLGEINIGSKTYGIYMKGGNTQIVKPGSKEAKAGKKNDLISSSTWLHRRPQSMPEFPTQSTHRSL